MQEQDVTQLTTEYIDRFSYIGPSLHYVDIAYFPIVNDVVDVFKVFFCEYFIEYFCINVDKRNQSEFSLC